MSKKNDPSPSERGYQLNRDFPRRRHASEEIIPPVDTKTNGQKEAVKIELHKILDALSESGNELIEIGTTIIDLHNMTDTTEDNLLLAQGAQGSIFALMRRLAEIRDAARAIMILND